MREYQPVTAKQKKAAMPQPVTQVRVPSAISAHRLIMLQRTVGNAVVNQLLRQDSSQRDLEDRVLPRTVSGQPRATTTSANLAMQQEQLGPAQSVIQRRPFKRKDGSPSDTSLYTIEALTSIRNELDEENQRIVDAAIAASDYVRIIEDYFKEPEPERMKVQSAFTLVTGFKDFLFTEGGKHNMVIDLRKGETLDKMIRKYMERVKMRGFFSDPTTQQQFNRVLEEVHGIPTNKEQRDQIILDKGTEDLGTMVERGYTMCWEKASFTHMLLSELGIKSTIVSGKDTSGPGHHAWVELAGTIYSIEATAGFIAPSDEYKARFEIFDRKEVLTPENPLPPNEVAALVTSSKKVTQNRIHNLAVIG